MVLSFKTDSFYEMQSWNVCAVCVLMPLGLQLLYHATTSYSCTSSILKSSYKAICYVLDDDTVSCIVCATVQGSLFVFYASLWEELQQPVSSSGLSAQNATPATPSCTGFSWLLTLCVWWLLLYMPFMGSQIMLGVLILECGFQALPGQWVRLDLYIYYTKS